MAQKSDTTLVMQAEVAATTELDVPKDTTLVIEDLDREGFHAHVPKFNIRPLWDLGAAGFNPWQPHTRCTPHVWSYKENRPLLMHSGKVTTTIEAERRALLFINPGRKEPPYTTDTTVAALQLLLPGERAKCHRHTTFAIRFLIEGEKGFTAVGGKKMYMEKGDLILTTQFEWHDHGNDGQDPVIWMDGLDMPLFAGSFPVNFQENFEDRPEHKGERFHPAKTSDNNTFPNRYPWRVMKAKLDTKTGSYAQEEYLNPAMPNQHISRTLAAYAEHLEKGATSPEVHETCNQIYHVVEGSGETEVQLLGRGKFASGGEKVTLKWTKGDSFSLPSWMRFHHKADTDAYLFHFNDRATLDNLGFYMNGLDQNVFTTV